MQIAGIIGGTGIGLASVYGIIKNHGGFVEVESEKIHGTAFHIYLPVSSKGVKGKVNPTENILHGTETILIVDDEPIVLDVSHEILETLGYRAITPYSGKEALNIYAERKVWSSSTSSCPIWAGRRLLRS